MALEVYSTGNSAQPQRHYDVSIQLLRDETRTIISTLLNPIKMISTDNGISRDWQGLAQLIGITVEQLPQLKLESDPTSKVLMLWFKKDKENCTIKRLLQFFEELDRFDIIDDIKPLVDTDIEVFEKNNNQLQPANSSSEVDRLILTTDDVARLNQGLAPQRYDAFVLFADEDIDFATRLLETMEKDYNLKLCVKDRDLVGGAFEHEVIIKLIAERCNRLVVIISPAFLKSAANTFFYNFAQALGIEQRDRKIVPCLYQRCKTLPPEYRGYVMLDYERSQSGKLWNFWEKLRDSIQTPKSIPIATAPVYNRSVSEQIPHNRHNYFQENHLRSSLHHKRLTPLKTAVKFKSTTSLNVEPSEDVKPDPSLNQSPSSSSLITMNPVKPEDLKPNKTKTSWLKKMLNKNEKKAEKKSEKKSKKSEDNKKSENEGGEKGDEKTKMKSENKMENNTVIEKVHHKSRKHFWTMPIKRKVAILN